MAEKTNAYSFQACNFVLTNIERQLDQLDLSVKDPSDVKTILDSLSNQYDRALECHSKLIEARKMANVFFNYALNDLRSRLSKVGVLYENIRAEAMLAVNDNKRTRNKKRLVGLS